MPQNRLIWACEAVGFAPDGTNTYVPAHGVQDIGITTTFNLEPMFELGQSRIYQNIEGTPDVEIQMSKVLDGYPPLYTLATRNAPSATLFGRSAAKCSVAMSLFPDTSDSASGVPLATVESSGMTTNSVSYTIPAEGSATESVTLIGSEKIWKATSSPFSGGFNNTDSPLALTMGSGGIQQRQNIIFDFTGTPTLDVNGQLNATALAPFTVLPRQVAGITPSGYNAKYPGSENRLCSITNISVSAELAREALNELGHKSPYARVMNPQVEVTTQIDIINKSGDWVNASEKGTYAGGANTVDSTIKIAMQEGLFIDCGTKNRLTTISETGGEAGGGNRTVSYTFSTYNDFTVTHHQDPTTALRP